MLQGFREYLQDILTNKYRYKGYYDYKTGEVQDWEKSFNLQAKEARTVATKKDTERLFDLGKMT